MALPERESFHLNKKKDFLNAGDSFFHSVKKKILRKEHIG
jgi:hypothetical protein